VTQYLVNDSLVLNRSNHSGVAATLWTERYIDIEYTFQALRPGDGLMPLFGCFAILRLR